MDSTYEVIVAAHRGEQYYAVLELRPYLDGLLFIVHYGSRTGSDGRMWYEQNSEERRRMRSTARRYLLRLVREQTGAPILT